MVLSCEMELLFGLRRSVCATIQGSSLNAKGVRTRDRAVVPMSRRYILWEMRRRVWARESRTKENSPIWANAIPTLMAVGKL